MKAHGNMYEGVVTWNPLGGECQHFCKYCSTKSLMRYPVIKAKYSGPLTLNINVKIPGEFKTVFVCAQNDLFADNVPIDWIEKVLARCKTKDNTYLFQTKNPERFIAFDGQFPDRTILCTTIETNRYYPEMGNAPSTLSRAIAMSHYRRFITRHCTIEPIMDFDLEPMVELIKITGATVVNIGADSKNHHLPEPSKEKVLALIAELQKFTIIARKTNLTRLLK